MDVPEEPDGPCRERDGFPYDRRMQQPSARVRSWRDRAGTIATRWRGGERSDGWPPGDLEPLDTLEKADRTVLVQRAAQYGPIFSGVIRDEPTVCIVGLARCRRFLQEHADALEVATLDLTAMFPIGFMRAMHGEEHLDYRRRLVRAVRAADADVSQAEFRALANDELARHAAAAVDDGHRPETWSATLSTIATSMLVRVFFGAPAGSELHASLLAGFRDLGPHGLVWRPEQRQHLAFDRLQRDLRAELASSESGTSVMSPTCVMAAVARNGELDDTMLGNLIYMVEMGRSDIQNFLRWLSRYAASDPALCAAIATADRPNGGRPPEEALVLEVLRSDQSERLERRLARDIEFEGFRIPAGTPIRLCMWESHHDVLVFADPFAFTPERFIDTDPTNDQFAPFGLDHHQCPFGTLTMRIGTAFVRALCALGPTVLADGPPRRGPYHWEPARQLSIGLAQR